MNMPIKPIFTPLAAAMTLVLLSACAMKPTAPEGSAEVRAELIKLQTDPQLARYAPVAIQEADAAVIAAEKPTKDKELSAHLVMLADRKVNTALALAQTRFAEDQRGQLRAQGDSVRLDARTLEADQAHSEANAARMDVAAARSAAASARTDTQAALLESADLQRQITALNAKATERGLVVTLGDVLFESGKSGLKGGSTSNLSKLAGFLNTYQDRTIVIEGHTDSVGSESANMSLSQRRADSVQNYLINQGVNSYRVSTMGLGESAPVAGNDTATGRQQNRRVEVIISNNTMSLVK